MTPGERQGGRHLTRLEQRPCMQGHELRARGDALRGQGLEPAEQRRQLAGLERRPGDALDEAEGALSRAGCQGVLDRLRDEPGSREVARCALVHVTPLLVAQLGAQVVGEQVMVAIPAPFPVERDQEQVGAFSPLEDRLGVLAIGQLAAQLGREPLRDRGLQEERAEVLIEPGEHLVREVVEHEPLAAMEGRDRSARVRPALERDGRELQPGDPALRPLD